ncbi:hypothetical protein [Aquimarina sp. RZ0]|nr:hypothetical protein [Aquimarina sp. RZ0]
MKILLLILYSVIIAAQVQIGDDIDGENGLIRNAAGSCVSSLPMVLS